MSGRKGQSQRISRIFVGSVLGSSEGSSRAFPIFLKKAKKKKRNSVLTFSNWPFFRTYKQNLKTSSETKKNKTYSLMSCFLCGFPGCLVFFFALGKQAQNRASQKKQDIAFFAKTPRHKQDINSLSIMLWMMHNPGQRAQEKGNKIL